MLLSQHNDVITYVESELRTRRVRLAIDVDRVEALAELRALAFEFAAHRGVATLSADDLWNAPRDEQELARLRALVDRALPDKKEPHYVP